MKKFFPLLILIFCFQSIAGTVTNRRSHESIKVISESEGRYRIVSERQEINNALIEVKNESFPDTVTLKAYGATKDLVTTKPEGAVSHIERAIELPVAIGIESVVLVSYGLPIYTYKKLVEKKDLRILNKLISNESYEKTVTRKRFDRLVDLLKTVRVN